MGRRIFEEKRWNVTGRVLAQGDFKLFADLPQGFSIDAGHRAALVAQAEALLHKDYPALLASDYMMFRRDGNRSVYEDKFFVRREDILVLALAEHVEKKGRFVDAVIDLLWMMLEETTWVLPAHNKNDRHRPELDCVLPFAYTGEVDYIDLFAATTAAALSFVYYLCRDALDGVCPLVGERLLHELDRRIIKPFLNPVHQAATMWWTGVSGNRVNNWCPWIVSNVLTVAALTVSDTQTREAVVRASLPMLDNFTSVYFEDGGCDEGPSYWDAAGGALFNACLVLFDMTAGYVNAFDDPLLKNMGEYAVKAVICKDRVLNFADSPAKLRPNPALICEWGILSGSEMMTKYGQSQLDGGLCASKADRNMPYRSIRLLCRPVYEKCVFTLPKRVWLDGLAIAVSRECEEADRGLYLAFKGGHNGESHNHNDVGNIVVFADGEPIFLDAGSGRYTRKTFSTERYSIWAMCSDYHNTATLGGVTQRAGSQAHSSCHVYDEETGRLSMELSAAYPRKANIESYQRSAVLENATVTVTDTVALRDKGDVMFSYLCNTMPTELGEAYFVLRGRKVTFDSSLVYAIEPIDCSAPEVERIPRLWDCDALYRITLKSKEPVKSKTYVMTVK